MTLLTRLDISFNSLNYFPLGVYQLENLRFINANNNNISTLCKSIDDLINLEFLNLCNNKIVSLPKEITNLYSLRMLNLSHNLLEYLPNELGDFISLTHLDLNDNNLQELPLSIINLDDTEINIDNNPEMDLDYRIENFLNRHNDETPPLNIYTYNDTENVHASSIHNSVRDSIKNLLTDSYVNITKDALYLDIQAHNFLINEQLNDINVNIKAVHILASENVDYYIILKLVWNRIINNIYKDELLKRLREEIEEGMTLCFVGKISRLINSLVGFCSDINISISIREQIGNIVYNMTLNKEITSVLINEIKTELIARSFPDNLIDEWILNIM